MSPIKSRKSILLLIAFAVGAGSLLAAGSALADVALFRIEQRWHNFPNPPVTSGGAGMYQGYVFPYYLDTVMGDYLSPPETAKVANGNPVGGAFTLPSKFFETHFQGTLTPKTAWPGYTTTYYYSAYNGPGNFEPNFGSSAKQLRLVFPTTGNNPIPNYGTGNPNLPTVGGGYCADGAKGGTTVNGAPTGYGCGTTTFSGRYDKSRVGSLFVTPGANRFGGTFRLFFFDTAHWDQFIFYFSPVLYEGYGSYFCFDDGMRDCTPDTFVSEPGTTQIYNGIWWLLTEAGKARAKTPATSNGTTPTYPYGNYSYLRREQHYLNLIHPWTTGYAKAVNAQGNQGTGIITPKAKGYDISLSNVTLSVKKYDWNLNFNKTIDTFTTTTTTPYTQILKGVTRVVSMVRPRLTWTLAVPLDPSQNPIQNIWSPVRMRELKVFFLPEPGGMLMLGVGIASLLGLYRLRRR